MSMKYDGSKLVWSEASKSTAAMDVIYCLEYNFEDPKLVCGGWPFFTSFHDS